MVSVSSWPPVSEGPIPTDLDDLKNMEDLKKHGLDLSRNICPFQVSTCYTCGR